MESDYRLYRELCLMPTSYRSSLSIDELNDHNYRPYVGHRGLELDESFLLNEVSGNQVHVN